MVQGNNENDNHLKASQSKKRKRKSKTKEAETEEGDQNMKDPIIQRKTPASSSPSSETNTGNNPTPSTNSFESVSPPLSPGILSALHSHFHFQTMTPVQSSTIPLFLQNKDVCVQAVTGSGKTLSFLIPIIEMILRRPTLLTHKQIGALIISPTRELARQTYNVAKILCDYTSLPQPLLLVGGGSGYRPVREDIESFHKHGSDIVIGTPGRIEDVLTRYSELYMNELECLILDEADVLLAMGFEVALTNILSKLPKMRRTGLFSATKAGMEGEGNKDVKRLMARAGLRNPVMINVAIACNRNESKNGATSNDSTPQDLQSNSKSSSSSSSSSSSQITPQEQATPTSLTNYYLISPLDEQLTRLITFIQQHPNEKIIIFFMTCANVEYFGLILTNLLPKSKFYIELLHGKLAPKRREKAMERFRNGGVESSSTSSTKESQQPISGGILLCTDVAARGLDVPDIHWTIQFDAPVDPSQYIHRVGRSARAGRFGSSLIFLSSKEESFIDFLRMRKVPIDEIGNEELCSPNRSIVKRCTGNNDDTGKEGSVDNNDNNSGCDDDDDDKVSIPNVLNKIRKMVLNDRDLLEKGTKAFTSYIRAYKEHKMLFIFR